jgi:hypothetical protein
MTEFKGLEDYYKYLFFYILIIASLKAAVGGKNCAPTVGSLGGDVGV